MNKSVSVQCGQLLDCSNETCFVVTTTFDGLFNSIFLFSIHFNRFLLGVGGGRGGRGGRGGVIIVENFNCFIVLFIYLVEN